MPEQAHNPKYKVGDEISVEFLGRVVGVRIDKKWITGEEKVIYEIEGNQARAYNVPESNIYPLPTPEDFPPSSKEKK